MYLPQFIFSFSLIIHYTIYYTIFAKNDDFWRLQTKSKNPQKPCKIRLYGLWHHRTKPPQTNQEVSANFFKNFLTRLNEKVISGFLLFSFFLKSGVDFTSAIMLSCKPRLSYGMYISWLWAVHSRPSGLFRCGNGCRGGGWRPLNVKMSGTHILLSFTVTLWLPGRKDGWKRTMNLYAMFSLREQLSQGLHSPGTHYRPITSIVQQEPV